MKILVTGSKGFVGRNLIAQLHIQQYEDILECDMDTAPELLDGYTHDCDFVFHLAGVNRPKDPAEFMAGNLGFTSVLLENLKKHSNKCPVLITSSIQAELDNPYGLSKRAEEDSLFCYEKETGVKILVYRLPNVFGKWCRPNYNSVVATFCHNIANDLPICVNDPSVTMRLVYIDDLVFELIAALHGRENRKGNFCMVEPVYTRQLGEIAKMIRAFYDSRSNLSVPNMADPFESKLYSTYLSYLPEKKFSYPLKMNVDNRGSFTEFIRTLERGQYSINISKPGITKGNHWHNSKNEKFLVVKGEGLIRFRRVDSDKIIEYAVSGDKLEVVDIPTGYTHSIVNVGQDDLVTVMWANECFSFNNPDTVFLEVEPHG